MKFDIKVFVNRPQVWGTIVSIAVMAVLSIAFFYPDSLDGNTLQQHDVQQGIANGEEARAFHEATGETTRWTNSLFGGMPTFQISPSYPSNSLFEWIGKVYSLGLPSTSGLLMMMMMGMYILLMALRQRWYYALIGAVAWGFSSYFIIIIGAGHIWKFLALTYVPPTLAGVVLAYRGRYMLGGAIAAVALMMQIAANHIQMTYYFGFLIFIMILAWFVRAIVKKQLMGWCKSSLSLFVAAVLAVAANSPSLYNTYKYSTETIRGGHSELTSDAGDKATSNNGLDRDYITQYSYGISETFSLLIPDVKGGASAKPVKGHMQPLSVTDLDGAEGLMRDSGLEPAEQQYISQFVLQYFGEPESTNGPVYVGAIIFALFLLGCLVVDNRSPLKWALISATVLSIFLAWGRNFMSLTDIFIDFVPMYNKFRTPESILVIAQLTMPVLGIMGLCTLFTGYDRKKGVMMLLGSFGFVAFLCLLGWLFPGVYGSGISEGDRQIAVMIGESLQHQGYGADVVSTYSIANPRIASVVSQLRLSMVSADAGRSLLLILLAGSIIYIGIKSTREQMAVGAVGLLILIDLYTVDKRYVSHDSFVEPAIATASIPMTQADRIILEDHDYYRVMPMGNLFQSANPSYYHKSLGGYHAAKLTRYQDMIERHLLPAASGQFDETKLNIISMLNGKYIIDPNGGVIPNTEAMGHAWFVDTLQVVNGADAEMEALDYMDPRTTAVLDARFVDMIGSEAHPHAPSDTIMLADYAPNKLTYDYSSSNGGTAVFSEVYFPWGWTATLENGEELPIARVNYLLRAVNLPKGKHTLTMVFDPKSLHVTNIVAVIAIILIYLWLLAALLVKKPANQGK